MDEKEKKKIVEDVVAGVQGDGPRKEYVEPPVPSQYQGADKIEYLQKTLSAEEFGRYLAHRELDPTFVKKEDKEDE